VTIIAKIGKWCELLIGNTIYHMKYLSYVAVLFIYFNHWTY